MSEGNDRYADHDSGQDRAGRDRGRDRSITPWRLGLDTLARREGRRTRRRLRETALLGVLLVALLVLVVVLAHASFTADGSAHLAADGQADAPFDALPGHDARPLDGSPECATLSLLGSARPAAGARGSFVPLDAIRSSWIDTEKAVSGIVSTERELRMSWPAAGLAGLCVHVVVGAGVPARLAWRDSRGVKGLSGVLDGVASVETTCVTGQAVTDLHQLTLSVVPAGTAGSTAGRARVLGAWILPPDAQAPQGPPALERCTSGGWKIEPAGGVTTSFLFRHDDVIEVEVEGPAASEVDVVLRDDVSARTIELEEQEQGRMGGTWTVASGTSRPGELSVTLPAGAGAHACVRGIDVRRVRSPGASGPTDMDIDGVVVILVDTLRADHLSFIDERARVSTPNLEALADESVLFANATAHSNYTKPSVGTLLTGVYPHVHGALLPRARLRASVPLLTQHLLEEGIDTQAVVSNHFFNNRKFGFFRGWSAMQHVNSYTACLGGEPVAERVHELLEQWTPDGPFFAYVHLMDPHSPYAPPSSYIVKQLGRVPTGGRFLPTETSQFIRKVRRGDEPPPGKEELALLRGLYRADVSHMDRVVGSVLESLRQAGILDRVLLVLVSDHGEEFMEHGGLGHGTNVRRELVHVPLLVRWPGGAVTGRIEETVGLVDVAPTIFAALGVSGPASVTSGRNLVDLVSGSAPFWEEGPYLLEHKNTKQKGIVAGQWKMLVGRKQVALTHVRNGKEWEIDPADHPVTVRYLGKKMTVLLAGRGTAAASAPVIVELSDDEKERLRALGYLLGDE